MPHLYETPAITIGKHEWRMIVTPSRFVGNCTDYQFRPIGGSIWRDSHDWPSYNHNDGTYGGLPRSLRRLYDRHQAEVIAALEGQQAPQQSMEV